MEIHLKKQSLSGSFTTSGKARQLKSFCNLTKREFYYLVFVKNNAIIYSAMA